MSELILFDIIITLDIFLTIIYDHIYYTYAIIGIIDTPGSGTHTYKVQIRSSRNSNFYWNMNQASNLGNYSAQTCSMTLSEVAA